MPKGIKGFQKGSKEWNNPNSIKNQFTSKNHPHYWKNKKFSKRHKEKLSITHKNPTKETRKKMSDARKGKYNGSNHPMWKGGKRIQDGYILIYSPQHPFARSNYIFEHRLVVEKHLGRYLKEEERVHHINGIRSDNHSKNLMVFGNISAHIKFEAIQKGMQEGEIIFDGRLLHS